MVVDDRLQLVEVVDGGNPVRQPVADGLAPHQRVPSHRQVVLLGEGHEVACLDNFDNYYSPEVKRRNIARALQHPAYRLFEGDLRDQDDVLELLREVRPEPDPIVTHRGVGYALREDW